MPLTLRSKNSWVRLPVLAAGFTIAVLGFYFLFLRPARTPAAEASTSNADAPVAAPTTSTQTPATEPVGCILPAPAAQDSSNDQSTAADKLDEARDEIGRQFAGDLSDAQRAELATKAIALNQKLLVTNPDAHDVDIAEIQQGENPTTFSKRFKQLHGEYGVILLLNGIKNVSTIRAGTKLRVPKGVWSIVVDKSQCAVYLCYQGAPYKTYRCCVGADDKTPAAKFTVGTKNPKPTWTAPADWLEKEKMKNPIPYDHPKNPLGEYWIGIDNPAHSGFGIHGTNAPDTIGSKASQGCVRLLNDDVLELARIVWKGMDVTILE